MQKEFTFIKIIPKGLIGLLLVFNISSPIFAQQPVSLIKLEKERGWIGSLDFIYSSNISRSEKMRIVTPTFSGGYILNKKWSFTCNIPCEYKYLSYREEDLKRRENIFALGNIEFIPSYRFKWRNRWIELPICIQTPTLNKISGNLSFGKTEKENRIFAIEPGIIISKTYDPIISSIKFSFVQPLWRKEDKRGIYIFWTAKVGGNIYFLINEQFSFYSDLGVYIGGKRENYIFQSALVYHPKPYREWRVYLLNNYEAGRWDGSIGLSFTIMQREGKEK